MVALIGRDTELAAVRDAVERRRVVTLTGPAGVGKTSLAAAVARDVADSVFCDLSDATSLNGAHSALAASLGVKLADVRVAGEAAQRLTQALTARAVRLLVIDNCEHVRAAAAALATLALDVDGLSVLVTSREELSMRAEHVIPVPQLSHDDAVALLYARAAVPDLGADADARAAAARVVEKLDRLPLAIELFAARLDLLTLPELEARLERPLAVLRGGPSTGRHADVAAAIRWSWDLLDDHERLVMRACAMFRGGATFDALAAALTRLGYGDGLGAGDAKAPGALLDDLASLRKKYLLFTERRTDGVRYHMLETVEAFVHAVIEDEGRFHELAVAHAHAALHKAATVDNLAAALSRCASAAPDLAARAGLALHKQMAMHGPMHAHLEMLDAAIACAEAAGVPDLCRRLYCARGDTRRKVGRVNAAAVDLEEALAHADSGGGRADVRASQAMLAMVQGDLDAAVALIAEAEALADAAEDLGALGRALQRAGAIHLLRGAYPLVEETCLRALRCLEHGDDVRSLTNALTYLGIGRLDRGDRPAARKAFDEARAKYVEQADTWSIAVCDAYLALILIDTRDEAGALDEALPRLERARADAQRVGHARLEAFLDAALGITHQLAGRRDDAEASFRRGVGLSLQTKDILSGAINAAHLSSVLAARERVEARHWLDTAVSYIQLMPNPAGQAALLAFEGVLSLAAGDRAEMEALRKRAAALGSESGVHLRLALRVLDAAVAGSAAPSPRVARVAMSKSGCRVVFGAGPEIDFTRRGAMRRILRALVDAHGAGRSLSVPGLIDAGWPGEIVETEAGTARVYTAIKSLRRLGLDDVLVTRDDGYALAADTRVELLAE